MILPRKNAVLGGSGHWIYPVQSPIGQLLIRHTRPMPLGAVSLPPQILDPRGHLDQPQTTTGRTGFRAEPLRPPALVLSSLATLLDTLHKLVDLTPQSVQRGLEIGDDGRNGLLEGGLHQGNTGVQSSTSMCELVGGGGESLGHL